MALETIGPAAIFRAVENTKKISSRKLTIFWRKATKKRPSISCIVSLVEPALDLARIWLRG